MNLYDKAKQLSDKDFKQIIGVEKETFDKMVMILNEAYLNKPRKWGSVIKLLTITKPIPIDEKTNNNLMDCFTFRKTDCFIPLKNPTIQNPR